MKWLVATLVLLVALALLAGEQRIAPADLIEALLGHPDARPDQVFILRELRLPRVLMALMAGAALGAAGTICQAALRNPLAEPGLIGINGGASLAVMVMLLALPGWPAAWVPAAALVGALVMVALLQLLGAGGGSLQVILIGIGLSAFCGGLSGALAAFGDPVALQRALIWMAGSLLDSRWATVALLAGWLLPAGLVLLLMPHWLDLVRLEDMVLSGLGLRPGPLRAGLLLLAALLAAAAVAACGPIAFIGLLAPHLARRIAGPAHAGLLPSAALSGAALLLLADTLGRSVIAPAQVPAGIVAALLGTPFLGWLIYRSRDG